MIAFGIKDLVFSPMYPLHTMIIIAVGLIVVVLLNKKNIINRLLIIALLVLISQRPMLKNQNEVAYNLNLDVLFVVDNTVSMNAIDVNGSTRLEAVKRDCNRIVDLMSGANFALITYGNVSIVKHPFTSDVATIKTVINQMKIIDPYYANGSSLDMPYDSMKLLLESSNKKEKHQRIVFFMGDGELIGKEKSNTNFNKYDDIKGLVNNGLVMGYGSENGSKVKITESINITKIADSDGFLIDSSNKNPSISRINEDNLKKLASILSIDYSHMPNNDVLQEKIVSIKEESAINDDEDKNLDKDIYYYFSGALIILLLLELFHYRRDER